MYLLTIVKSSENLRMPYALLTARYNSAQGSYECVHLDDPSGLILGRFNTEEMKARKRSGDPIKLYTSPLIVLNAAEELGFELAAGPPRISTEAIILTYSWHLCKDSKPLFTLSAH
ncbi:unnamed protein product, partial [Mesorhabditis spiculigera]